MIGPGEVMAVLITVFVPTLFLLYLARRFFSFKEKQLEVNAAVAAQKAAEYAASNTELEARVRVLEQIVTDGGAQTAAQIEALRQPPRLAADKRLSAEPTS